MSVVLSGVATTWTDVHSTLRPSQMAHWPKSFFYPRRYHHQKKKSWLRNRSFFVGTTQHCIAVCHPVTRALPEKKLLYVEGGWMAFFLWDEMPRLSVADRQKGGTGRRKKMARDGGREERRKGKGTIFRLEEGNSWHTILYTLLTRRKKKRREYTPYKEKHKGGSSWENSRIRNNRKGI